jgi:hypothetical protein
MDEIDRQSAEAAAVILGDRSCGGSVIPTFRWRIEPNPGAKHYFAA